MDVGVNPRLLSIAACSQRIGLACCTCLSSCFAICNLERCVGQVALRCLHECAPRLIVSLQAAELICSTAARQIWLRRSVLKEMLGGILTLYVPMEVGNSPISQHIYVCGWHVQRLLSFGSLCSLIPTVIGDSKEGMLRCSVSLFHTCVAWWFVFVFEQA